MVKMVSSFGILIHSGASKVRINKSSKKARDISKSLRLSVSGGYEYLKGKKGTAIDAVEAAVTSLEDSGIFNAGIGSSLTYDKQIEMDASIMDGKETSAGSVGMVQNLRNPVKLARLVMERTDHVMIVSDGATKLAKTFGSKIEYLKPSPESNRMYYNIHKDMEKVWKKNQKLLSTTTPDYGTVGAVAIDREGNVASAVSTGGRWLKLHGRIGDSAVIGAGFYADNESGAACATGNGEYIMRLCLCKYACDQMKQHDNASLVSQETIALLTRRFGQITGGVILVDKKAQFAAAMNTESMPVALLTSETRGIKIALNKDETLFSFSASK
jgi:beta-aspartyl-peptidase (threonine type)